MKEGTVVATSVDSRTQNASASPAIDQEAILSENSRSRLVAQRAVKTKKRRRRRWFRRLLLLILILLLINFSFIFYLFLGFQQRIHHLETTNQALLAQIEVLSSQMVTQAEFQAFQGELAAALPEPAPESGLATPEDAGDTSLKEAAWYTAIGAGIVYYGSQALRLAGQVLRLHPAIP